MIVPFLYALRRRKLPVGTLEAVNLARALSLGLHASSLDGFYEVARALLVHSEQHLDDFDMAFAEHFRGVTFDAVKITEASHTIDESDIAALRKAGWTDEDISDIAETAAMFNFSNRMANALGWVPNELYHSFGRAAK